VRASLKWEGRFRKEGRAGRSRTRLDHEIAENRPWTGEGKARVQQSIPPSGKKLLKMDPVGGPESFGAVPGAPLLGEKRRPLKLERDLKRGEES